MPINALRPGHRRDTQRSRVYKAERVIHLTHDRRGPDPKFREIDACQEYVARVTTSAWYQRTFPKHSAFTVRVAHGSGCSSARATGASRISLPAWARQKAVILHELAHNIVHVTYRGAAWHGWEFCAVFVQLVQHEMGAAAAAKLKTSFKANRVRFRAPRQLSPEQRSAAAARLATYRQAACVRPNRDLDVALARGQE